MPRIGIVVEGLDDEAALPELIQRSLTTQVEIVARHWGPASVLMRNFRVSLEEFRSLDIHLAIVIRDADNKPTREIYQRMQDRVSGRE